MKRVLSLSLVLILSIAFADAKIWRVNNNPGADADFTTAATAITGASAGDTCYFEASATSYGNANLTKKLVFIGPGYFLGTGTNDNDSLQALPQEAYIAAFTVALGADTSSIMGMSIQNAYIYASNVFFKRSHFIGITYLYASCSNLMFGRCYFGHRITEQSPGSKSNLNFINCIMQYYLTFSADDGGLIENCTMHLWPSGGMTTTLTGFILRNNIMNRGLLTCTTCTQQNNIGSATQFPVGNGNQQNVLMTTVFEGTGSLDAKWKLKAGSPASGAGLAGVDCGAFGGVTPYKLSGIPNIPAIYHINTGNVINNNVLNVNLSTRSNN